MNGSLVGGRGGVPVTIGCAVALFVLGLDGTNAAQRVTVELQESDEVLANPGMGWQTFHRFADEDPALQGLPSASAYFRFYWREIETRDGAIDFPRFDELLKRARRAGQKLAFRVMCTGSGAYMDVPEWLKAQGCRGMEFQYAGGKHWVPDLADPLFQEKHGRLVRELGRRYDGHPDLDLVDIGSVGLWGEWHMSGTRLLDGDQPVPLPPEGVLQGIIQLWCEAFPTANKVILIGSNLGMPGTASGRFGWRADCLGDMGGFSKSWNHMNDFYLQQLDRTGAKEAWRKAPVAFESCWDMRKWKEAGWDIPFIFDYALRCHASYLNNKSAPLPGGVGPELERFLKKLGYRLVLRSVEYDRQVRTGQSVLARMQWDNLGVAPPYRDYRLALRFLPQSGQLPAQVVMSEESVRGWLPGPRRVDLRCSLPSSLMPGSYAMSVGVVDPLDRQPGIRLANQGGEAGGWYRVGTMELCAESESAP